MITRLDEIAKRLFSFFVSPLINVIIVSALLNICISDQYSVTGMVANLDVSGLTKYFSDALVAIFSGNFDSMREFLTRNSGQIATASTIVGILLVLTILLVMYVLDRFIYAFGWLFPRDFEFDHAAYAAANWESDRMRRLYALLGRSLDFATAYGVAKSFLGELSVDQDRAAHRGDLARAQRVSRTGFDYALSYCCLLLVAFVLALFYRHYFSFGGLVLSFAIALFMAIAFLIWHANACQDLIEFDIDSFIRMRLYSRKDDVFLDVVPPDAPVLAGQERPKVVAGFFPTMYLRQKPAGVPYEVYRFVRRLAAIELRSRPR